MKTPLSSATMPVAHSQARTSKYVSRGLRILIAAVFLAAGAAKLAGVPAMVQPFDQLGIGQWFRFATAIVEVIGGIAVLIPAAAFLGGLLLSATMIGALLAHWFVIEGSAVPAMVLLLATAAITWLHRPSQPGATARPGSH